PHAEPPAPVSSETVQPTPPKVEWWSPWIGVVKSFGLWFISVLLLLFVPVIVALPYIFYTWAKYGPPTPEALGTDKTLLLLSVVAILPTHLLTFLAIWLFVSRAGREPFWKAVKFEWPQNVGPVIGSLSCILLAITLLVLAWLLTRFWGGDKTQLDLLIESSLPARFVTAFVAVATAPLVEELIYRGVLYPAIEKAAGMGVAVLVVSLLFAGVHVVQYINNLSVIAAITLLSFTLTLTRAFTRKLLPSFVIHFVFNGIQAIFLVLGPFLDKSGTG
ncbi:MAG TPA: type II CAAX endopeptidase family protein, partial [Pyrinomonadaceae bacterium]|nr:type II CAAX endopeptidase family protein [Pyrinomonadaceae bacterium]